MKSTDEQVRKIASILARQEDDEAVGRFLTLGYIRYDRDALNEMLGGGKMGLLRAILDGKGMEVDRARAAAQGEARGRAEEARKFLRLLLRKHFPELESLAQIDAISNADVLESIIESVLEATGGDAVRAAILTAAQPD